jgi:hypothetical protein
MKKDYYFTTRKDYFTTTNTPEKVIILKELHRPEYRNKKGS